MTNTQDCQQGGTVRTCTPADRAALTGLYFAVYPQATAENLAADIKDAEISWWITYKDAQGAMQVAMRVHPNSGNVWLFAQPQKCTSLEVMDGFLMLVHEARAVLTPPPAWAESV